MEAKVGHFIYFSKDKSRNLSDKKNVKQQNLASK